MLLHNVSERSNQTTSELQSIFNVRLKRLNRLLEAEDNPDLRTLRDDVAVLFNGLRTCQDDDCDFWLFDHVDGGSSCVYVGRRTRVVLGCVYNQPRNETDDMPIAFNPRNG